MRNIILTILTTFSLIGIEAHAATVTYGFAGVLTSYSVTPDGFFPTLAVGENFTGTLSYDDATSPLNNGIPMNGIYNGTGGMMTTTFSDGSVFSSEPVPIFQRINSCTGCIGNAEPAWLFDTYNFNEPGFPGGSFSGSTDPVNLHNILQLIGAYNGGSINPLPFSSYSQPLLRIIANRLNPNIIVGNSTMDAIGTLTSFQPVPIPAALPLFAAGLGAVALVARSKKRKAARPV